MAFGSGSAAAQDARYREPIIQPGCGKPSQGAVQPAPYWNWYMTDTHSPARVPSICVIVPNFNDARFIARCLRSVLEQEVAPDELIVVDDHSTDDSVGVIRSLIAGRPGAVLVENPVNLGTYGAVDAGLARSRSDYVLFLSANDFVLPGIFARAKACLARVPGTGLWSAMGWIVDEADRPLRVQSLAVVSLADRHFAPEECRRMAWRLGSWFTGTTAIYRRETLEAVGRFDPAYGGLSDLISALMVTAKAGAVFSPVPYAVIRQHSGSYLSKTLGDPHKLGALLERLRGRGAELAPELFTPRFLDRSVQRFVFAAIRSSGGARMGEFADLCGRLQRRLLALGDSIVPGRFAFARAVWAFLVLRPYDILPSFWNRFLGTRIVAARVRYGGNQA